MCAGHRQVQKALIDMENMFDLLNTTPKVDDVPGAGQLVVSQVGRRGAKAFGHTWVGGRAGGGGGVSSAAQGLQCGVEGGGGAGPRQQGCRAQAGATGNPPTSSLSSVPLPPPHRTHTHSHRPLGGPVGLQPCVVCYGHYGVWLRPQTLNPDPPSQAQVDFDRVVFGYNPSMPVLKGVSFTVPGGWAAAGWVGDCVAKGVGGWVGGRNLQSKGHRPWPGSTVAEAESGGRPSGLGRARWRDGQGVVPHRRGRSR